MKTKLPFLVSVSIFSALLGSCGDGGESQNDVFPPAKAIGIYDVYEGYENGELPSDVKSYTGGWKHEFPDGSAIEGMYRNGIPVGVWKSTYSTGIVRTVRIYSDDGKFQHTNYYPDGTPEDGYIGKYDPLTGKRRRNVGSESNFRYDAEWYGKPKDFKMPPWGTQITNSGGFFRVAGEPVLAHYIWTFHTDDTFSLWMWMHSEKSGVPIGYGKLTATGKYDRKAGKFAEFWQKTHFGDYKVRFRPKEGAPVLEGTLLYGADSDCVPVLNLGTLDMSLPPEGE